MDKIYQSVEDSYYTDETIASFGLYPPLLVKVINDDVLGTNILENTQIQ